METQVSAGAKTPRFTEAVGSTGPRGRASRTPTWSVVRDLNEAAVVLEDEVVSRRRRPRVRPAPPPGSGRPLLPILAPDTLASTACPSVVAKNSTTRAGANTSMTRCHSPVGMPEPMNSRTGWLPCNANDGSSMTSRSIAQV